MKSFKIPHCSCLPDSFGCVHGFTPPIKAQGQQQEKKNLFLVRKNGKWGYSGRNGEIVIKPQFKSANVFDNGWAEVWPNGQGDSMLIDANGHTVMSRNFSSKPLLRRSDPGQDRKQVRLCK